MPGGRRAADGLPPSRGALGRTRLIAIAGLIGVLIIAGIVVLLIGGGGSGSKSMTQMSSHGGSTSNPIIRALAVTNRSSTARGFIPPSSCQAQGSSMVTCSHPAFAVDSAMFTTYRSLHELYSGYVAKAKSLGLSRFRTNFGDCTPDESFGEVGWNHQYRHPRTYSFARAMSGRLSEDLLAGRLFCTFSGSQWYIVWTQNAGRLLGVVAGGPHADTWKWWRGVHHSIDLPGASSDMQMSGS